MCMHPSKLTICGFVWGNFEGEAKEAIENHLRVCGKCQKILEGLLAIREMFSIPIRRMEAK